MQKVRKYKEKNMLKVIKWIYDDLVKVLKDNRGFAVISKSYTFSAGATIVAAEHNSNFDTLYNDFNGNITNANLSASAAIALSKLSLSDDVTLTGDINFSNSATTDNIVDVIGNSLTTGYGLNITSTATNTSSRSLVYLGSTSTAATGCVGLSINNAGGAHLKLLGDPVLTATTAGDGAIWFDGSNFYGAVGTSPVNFASQIIQVVNTQTGAVATGTTAIPDDDTIPQKTEGDEYMTLAITPKSATNKLKIDVVVHLSHSETAIRLVAALFQDDTADALACGLHNSPTESATLTVQIVFTYYMTAGTTSETTFKVRCGGGTGATTTLNGSAGARKYGGVLSSSITITEIKA